MDLCRGFVSWICVVDLCRGLVSWLGVLAWTCVVDLWGHMYWMCTLVIILLKNLECVVDDIGLVFVYFY